MTVPYLPNELLEQIAEQAWKLCTSVKPRRECRNTNADLLYTFSRTSRLFCKFARSKRFESLTIDAIPRLLREEAAILGQSHIGKHVRSLKIALYEVKRDIRQIESVRRREDGRFMFRRRLENLDDLLETVLTEPLSNLDIPGPQPSEQLLDRTEAPPFPSRMKQIYPYLYQILTSCAPTLRSLSVIVTTSVPVEHGEIFFWVLADILSAVNFPSLRALGFGVDSLGIAKPFWTDTNDLLFQNLSRVHDFSLLDEIYGYKYLGLSLRNGIVDSRGPQHKPTSLRDFEGFLSRLPLKTLSLKRLSSYDEFPLNQMQTYMYFSTFNTLSTLRTLTITIAQIHNGFSEALSNFTVLQKIHLTAVLILHEKDTWAEIFKALGNLPLLQDVSIRNLGYSDGREAWCDYGTLCTTYREDCDSFHEFKQGLYSREIMRAWFSQNPPWIVCPVHSGQFEVEEEDWEENYTSALSNDDFPSLEVLDLLTSWVE